MQLWFKEMKADIWEGGSVVDKFVWTYCFYMLAASHVHAGKQPWLTAAVKSTERWLATSM